MGVLEYVRRWSVHFARPSYVVYVALIVLSVGVQLSIFLFHQDVFSVGPRIWLFNVLAEVAISALIALLLPVHFRFIGLVFPFLNLLLLWINAIYTSNFYDYIPLSLISAFRNVDSNLWEFVKDAYRSWMLGMSMPFMSLVLYYLLFRTSVENVRVATEARIFSMLSAVFLFMASQCKVLYDSVESGLCQGWAQHTYEKYVCVEPSMHRYVAKWGMTPAYVSALMPWFESQKMTDDDWITLTALQNMSRELKIRPDIAKVLSRNKDKNLILVIVESFSSSTLNRTVNGTRLMPYLDSVISSEGVIYFPNIITQVQAGVSSDGQLMYNTGFYPLVKTAVATSSSLYQTPSLARLIGMKGGRKVELICESPDLWNHTGTSKVWGYDTLYHNIGFEKREERVFSVCDSLLFKKAVDLIDEQGMPTMMTLCTHSMHGVFTEDDLGEFRPENTGQSVNMCSYWNMTTKFDKGIGWLIDCLKSRGLYDNTIIVIVSDHSPHVAVMPDSSRKTIPLIILNSGITFKSSVLGGQIDVYPTILDVMGYYDTAGWLGFGNSLLRNPKGVVGFNREGKWVVGKDCSLDSLDFWRINTAHYLSTKLLSTIDAEQLNDGSRM